MEDDGSPTVALGFGLAHRGLGVVAVEVRIGDLDQSGAAEAWLVAAVDNADGELAEALHGLDRDYPLGHLIGEMIVTRNRSHCNWLASCGRL